MAELATTENQIARPLRILIPLIQEDLKHGREASQRAGVPYYGAAGAKMLEAKPQMPASEFAPWINRHFGIGRMMASYYMKLAKRVEFDASALATPSLSDFIRKTANPNYNRPSAWHDTVKRVTDSVDTETLNRKRDDLARSEEREAQRQLAKKLITIGFRVLAKTLHPDKGGSNEALIRLKTVRDRLLKSI